MLSQGLITMSYVAAGVFFILSLGGLSHQESARRGNLFGMVGMLIALTMTLAALDIVRLEYLLPAILVGAAIGAFVASRVEMVQMPQMVALLHSFVGVAAVLVGFSNYLDPVIKHSGVERTIHNVEIYLGIFIGAITFTGSVVAFGKLQGVLSSKPLMLPARHTINLMIVLACILLGYLFLSAVEPKLAWLSLLIMTALALLLGVFLVAAIGGADMPIVVSMLNSYSGWAAAVTGFMLNNDLLIITGALVGSSGAILSYIMCRAMNRSFISVILGGFGISASSAADVDGEVKEIHADETARMLSDAKTVVIVPGYGMAVARAQNAISELVKLLREQNISVRFAIHPVAGRLPGHMNILLAEADVPYDIVFEMDEINPDLPNTDVVMVVGANDIVNPLAEDPNSLIAGMPVIEVWKASTVIVFKRSMATGYAGIDNPLFFNDNTRMQFGDAEASVRAILQNI